MVPFICIAVVVLGLRVVAADEGVYEATSSQCVHLSFSPQSAFAV